MKIFLKKAWSAMTRFTSQFRNAWTGMTRFTSQLHADECGQDLIEYALLVALIGLFSVTAMKGLANYISNAFNSVGSQFAANITSGS